MMASTSFGNVKKNTNKISFKDKTSKFPVKIEDVKFELFIGDELLFPNYDDFEELLIGLSEEIRMKTIMKKILQKLRIKINHDLNN